MNVYIIGAGNMGGAIARVLARKHRVRVFDRSSVKAKIPGTIFEKDLRHLSRANFVIVAVKPQDIAVLANQIKLKEKTILISVAAGVKIAKIQQRFHHKRVVRVMPNLGLKVGQGIAGWKSAGLTHREKSRAKKLLNQIIENFEVKSESAIDAITAISGSGPAYFFYLAEALRQAAMNLGFDADLARRLVEKTFSASAILQAEQTYRDLIHRVASKKGTTEAVLKVFKKYKMDKIINLAVMAAEKRAKELDNG